MSQPAGTPLAACCYASATDVLRLQSKKTLEHWSATLGQQFSSPGGKALPWFQTLNPQPSTCNPKRTHLCAHVHTCVHTCKSAENPVVIDDVTLGHLSHLFLGVPGESLKGL